MDYLQAIILGITQGLTEFIPVSSSGHLIVVGHLIGFSHSSLGFDTALDIGTLLALGIFFWKDIWQLMKGLVIKNDHTRLSWIIVLATIPGVIAGVILQSAAETVFRSSQLVAINLIIIAGVMLAADRLNKPRFDLSSIPVARGFAVGIAQALALIPGVSRSGITISAGFLAGFDRISATRFSFLLSGPIIAGATLKVMATPSNFQQLTAEPGLYLVAIISAFLSGLFAIGFMLRYLQKHGLAIFAYYRIAVGIIILFTGLR